MELEPETMPVVRELPINLGQSRADRVAMALKGLSGALPFVGGIVAEIVGVAIPGQRIDRLIAFTRKLEEKVSQLDSARLAEKMRSERFVDLLEDGLQQAARSLSEERRAHIAAFLKNSLANEAIGHAYEKRLLQLLGELNDVEILILRSRDSLQEDQSDFIEQHMDALQGPDSHMGVTQEEWEQAAVHASYRAHLEQIGLTNDSDVTTLGRMLLHYIDAIPPQA